ncbi:MAG TPA: respiratory nitrate reductase subunit gamma [Thermodesulfobacteriota bacterium]|nr:respiratory nitrate reductase subunit gamma [Thermodesulfobacteriota bacterium]
MTWLPYLSYISLLALVGGIAAKVIKYIRMPIHLRWELYPIPHEKKDGSYFEEVDWWKKPRKKHYLNQIIFMAQEILFIRALYHNNRKMWYASFPFHFGLYLVIAWLALLVVGAFLKIFGVASGLSEALQSVAVVVGVAGMILGTIGCVGLLIIRATSSDLHGYTAPVDYFNILFIFAVLGSGIIAWVSADPHFLVVQEYIRGLITFSAAATPSKTIAWHITLFSLFLIYLPFTHMTHFFMKYFMWDKVRFEDEPNFRGSSIEGKIAKVLNYTQNWSAPHIQTGKKWSETASKGVE